MSRKCKNRARRLDGGTSAPGTDEQKKIEACLRCTLPQEMCGGYGSPEACREHYENPRSRVDV